MDIELNLDTDERIKKITEVVAYARWPFRPFMGLANRVENESVLTGLFNDMYRLKRLGAMIEGEDTTCAEVCAVEKLGLVKIDHHEGSQFFMRPTEKLLAILEPRCVPAEKAEVAPIAPKRKVFNLRRLLGLKAG